MSASKTIGDFPRLLAALEHGVTRRLHTAAQVYVSVDGSPVLNAGFGQISEGLNTTPQHIFLWRSAGKPLLAVLAVMLLEEAEVSLDTPIGTYLPSAKNGAEAVAFRQILSHSTGWPLLEHDWREVTPRSQAARLLTIAPHPNFTGYQPALTWLILTDALQQVAGGRVPHQLLKERFAVPLNMENVHAGMSTATRDSLERLIAPIFEREKGQLVSGRHNSTPYFENSGLGDSLRGPVSALGRFYEMLLRNGTSANDEVIVPKSVIQNVTSRHRVGQFDQTLQDEIDFGLGLVINSRRSADRPVAYGFGRHASPNTFGHGGAQCAMGFCDPDRSLVVAWAVNGLCGEGQHHRRNSAINEAIYEDLGLAS